tara:strand:- start:8696 stop:9094 length:399 start_codon:yes stop_codon:yes gene_type:complete
MLKLKKAWLWFKNHWYVPFVFLLIVCAFLLFLVTRNSMYMGTLLDMLDLSQKNYQKERDVLDKISKEEREKRAKILDEYNTKVEELEKEYEARGEKLAEKKKKELKKLVEESYTDPEWLAKEIARLYGLENG